MVHYALKVSGVAIVLVSLAAAAGYAQERSMGKAGPSKAPGASAVASAPINLNTASSVALQTLPNVGAATAARILEYRQKNGGFKKIEDLMNVRGVGEKSFLKLKPLVSVAVPKTDRAAVQ